MTPGPPELPRLLALDLDGTLLPASKEITPHTRRVLESMRKLGCQITVATGKFHHLALQYGELLELELPQISHDGAVVGGNGHEPVHRRIPLEVARTLADRYEGESAHAFADDGEDRMLLRSATEAFQTATRDWANEFGHVDELGGHLKGDSAILSFYGEDRRIEEIYAEASASDLPLRTTKYWSELLGARRISFQPKGVDKGTGVLEVASRIAAQAGECMVFGDWYNDLPMFGIGATSVAMANAVPEVRRTASYVTEYSNEDDGVARFLENLFL